MQRTIALIAFAMVAGANAFAPLVELDSGDCVVKGEQLNKNEWALTTGACDDTDAPAVEFEFTKQGGAIATEDKLCIASKGNSSKNGTAVVLAKCSSKKKSQKWVLYEDNMWKNGYKMCLSYDAEEDSLVQVHCDEEPLAFELDGCDIEPKPVPSPAPAPITTTTVVPAPVPTPAPTPVYTCANFAASVQPGNACPYGYFVPSNYYTITTTPATAASQCCVPVATRTCGQYSVQMGGPDNVCKSKYGDFELTDKLYQTCSGTDNKDCFKTCCVPVAPAEQSCKAFIATGTDYKPACLPGTTPIADLATTFCKGDGSDCNAICCEPLVPPPTNPNIIKCSEWAAQSANNTCTAFLPNLKPDAECVVSGPIANCGANACCSQ